ncbi:SMP-30/gluconolactonase/LRE family protein [Niabella pedocola]|uniref:SMP-30/gluconolactonase/LRE family protein n=1 Tax=Niabella pedocola TaxID=1752077 RepID=A0ABS8PN53_9BACT|nr:SMP-30/gluconolactonase/LRE family protein [Niabella pedocola]MCD2422542.1 SMP-30/gluconolactonase/LRE family protein [Niabella pedocola]
MKHNIRFQEFKGDTQCLQLPFYTEGPVADAGGNLYVTNLQGGQILRIGKDGTVDEWARSSCPNGQMIAANGDHLICDSVEACVKRFDQHGRFRAAAIAGRVGHYNITCPNDLVSDGNGGFFFTDSVRHTGVVVHVDRSGSARLIAEQLDYPNGIVLDHKRRRLYIAESYQNRIVMINLQQHTGAADVFCNLPQHPSLQETANLPDGLALDSYGNLWVAHYGMSCIWKIDPGGSHQEKMDTDILLTSNVFLNNDRVLITGGQAEPGPGYVRIIQT